MAVLLPIVKNVKNGVSLDGEGEFVPPRVTRRVANKTLPKPNLGDDYEIGFYSQDHSTQIAKSDIVPVKELTETTKSLIKDSIQMKKDLAFIRCSMLADFELKLKEKSVELYVRMNERLLALEKKYSEKVEMMRSAYRQQLCDAIAQIHGYYNSDFMRKKKSLQLKDRDDKTKLKNLQAYIDTQETTIRSLMDQLAECESEEKPVPQNTESKDSKSAGNKLSEQLEKVQNRNDLLEELNDSLKMTNRELEREVERLKQSLTTTQRRNEMLTKATADRESFSSTRLTSKTIADRESGSSTRLPSKTIADRESGSSTRLLTKTNADRESFSSTRLPSKTTADRDSGSNTPLPSKTIADRESGSNTRMPSKTIADRESGSITRMQSKTSGDRDSRFSSQVGVVADDREEELKAKQSALQTAQAAVKNLLEEKKALEDRLANERVGTKTKLQDLQDCELLKKKALEMEAEAERLRREVHRVNKSWKKKFEILQDSMRALRDEFFLRQKLERKAAILHTASISYAYDAPCDTGKNYTKFSQFSSSPLCKKAAKTPLAGIGNHRQASGDFISYTVAPPVDRKNYIVTENENEFLTDEEDLSTDVVVFPAPPPGLFKSC